MIGSTVRKRRAAKSSDWKANKVQKLRKRDIAGLMRHAFFDEECKLGFLSPSELNVPYQISYFRTSKHSYRIGVIYFKTSVINCDRDKASRCEHISGDF
uniref:AlNc14C95G5831 protein n=1 Tax=Albugo laibachii Nc14 TaxID=890382 RepID=F0WGV5_9STRA|nr:AlNc14C95G5831 [Albugo laibachii Nc14]|eukprot:CCA20470.1 AlNc14C95G5831 [Albugo laibachii Nc14]